MGFVRKTHFASANDLPEENCNNYVATTDMCNLQGEAAVKPAWHDTLQDI